MNRRALLAAVAASGSLFAGCGSRQSPTDESPSTATATPSTSPVTDEYTLASLGFPSTICAAEVISDFHIRAIVAPVFGPDWDGIAVDDRYSIGFEGPGLPDGAPIIGVERGGTARAYPLSVVWWHEVVNDVFESRSQASRGESEVEAGEPLLVTYCPLCSSGMVAERVVDGVETVFGVSGQLWQPPGEYAAASIDAGTVFGASASRVEAEAKNSGNLVLYDEATESFWSQLLAQAICGPEAGEELTLVPTRVTSWGAWRREYPETDVLLPPPYSTLM